MEKMLLILIIFVLLIFAGVMYSAVKDLREFKNSFDAYVRLNEERHRLEKCRQAQKQEQVFVFNTIYKKWELTDFERLHDGDLFKIIQNGVRYTNPVSGDNIWVANGEPYMGSYPYEGWQIKTYY